MITRTRLRATVAGLGLVVLLGLSQPAAAALKFKPIGPPGGDVRSLAQDPSDPRRVYAGTVDGILYASLNGGVSWARRDPGFPLRGVSLDDLLVTETGEVIASFWKIDGTGGGIALSLDHGVTFDMIGAGLEGEAVRGLARSPSNPKTFVAVTRTGVFRSTDGAEHFSRISPLNHSDLRMVGSVAIDPRNENSILVGTAHLAWRTDTGGRTWRPIRQGMVNDSDVMTLTLDRREPATVFATACTGIWRSRNAGASWTKVLGIPSISRRTRAFAQDHNRPDTFYAGTTDGVYISEDDARTFTRTSAPGLVVNALISLGGGRVLAGVEGEGLLLSTDFGRSWRTSNDGFKERLIRHIVADETHDRLLVITGADGSNTSALFEQVGPRGSWRKMTGPAGREIRTLGLLHDGEIILGTNDGVFRGGTNGPPWIRAPLTSGGLDAHPQVHDLHVQGSEVLVATDQGLFISRDRGATFSLQRFGSSRSVVGLAVAPSGRVVVATSIAVYAADRDLVFRQVATVGLPGLKALAFAPGSDSKILAATSSGLFTSEDSGARWFQTSTPLSRVTAMAQHSNGRDVYAADAGLGVVFVSGDGGGTFWPLETEGLASQTTFAMSFKAPQVEGGPPSLIVAASGGGLLEATLEEGVPSQIKKR